MKSIFHWTLKWQIPSYLPNHSLVSIVCIFTCWWIGIYGPAISVSKHCMRIVCVYLKGFISCFFFFMQSNGHMLKIHIAINIQSILSVDQIYISSATLYSLLTKHRDINYYFSVYLSPFLLPPFHRVCSGPIKLHVHSGWLQLWP